MINKMSRLHFMTTENVRTILMTMKEDKKQSFVLEDELEEAVLMKKNEETLVKKFIEGDLYTEDAVQVALKKMKKNKFKLTEENLLETLANKNEQEFLEASQSVETSKEEKLAEMMNTSVEVARESLALHDDDEELALMALLNNNEGRSKSSVSRLAETFSISESRSKRLLERYDGDIEKASQDNELIQNLVSKSVDNGKEFASNVDDLLDDEDDETPGPTNPNKSLKSVSKGNLQLIDSDKNFKPITPATPKIKLIEPLAIPPRRFAMKPSIKKKTTSTKNMVHDPLEHKSDPEPMVAPENSKKSKEDIAEERRKRLKEISEKTSSRKTEKPVSDKAPVGVMKSSVPKNQKLLQDMEQDFLQPQRRRHSSNQKTSKTQAASSSSSGAGFLENEVLKDKEKLAKKDKYATTADGYKAVKKMSVDNVDYSVMSQDISKMLIDNVKPLQFPSLGVNADRSRKKVRWRDADGFTTIVDVIYIEANNKGVCVGSGNKVREPEIRHFGGVDNKRKPEIDMNTIFRIILDWKVVWLEQQHRVKKPPPLHPLYQPLPLPSTFLNHDEYVKIFLPLMLLELWSKISVDHDEGSVDKCVELPSCIQEVSRDSNQGFNVLRCMALLSDKVRITFLNNFHVVTLS